MTNALWDPELPALRETIVCYADILGFKEMTKHAFRCGKERDFLIRIKKALDLAHQDVRRFASLGEWSPPRFEMKLFTDNFLVACPIRDPQISRGKFELAAVLLLFVGLQARLAFEGFFLRGGIALGQHFQSGDIVYGDALLEAIGLDKTSGPPRLIVAPSVKPLILDHLSGYRGVESPYHHILLEDSRDGELFLNYLQAVLGSFPYFFIDYSPIAAHRDHVIEYLREYESNENIRKKYEWVATYHNYACTDVAERYTVPDPEWADPEHFDVAYAAKGLLGFLISIDYRPPLRPFDVERLRQRVSAG